MSSETQKEASLHSTVPHNRCNFRRPRALYLVSVGYDCSPGLSVYRRVIASLTLPMLLWTLFTKFLLQSRQPGRKHAAQWLLLPNFALVSQRPQKPLLQNCLQHPSGSPNTVNHWARPRSKKGWPSSTTIASARSARRAAHCFLKSSKTSSSNPLASDIHLAGEHKPKPSTKTQHKLGWPCSSKLPYTALQGRNLFSSLAASWQLLKAGPPLSDSGPVPALARGRWFTVLLSVDSTDTLSGPHRVSGHCQCLHPRSAACERTKNCVCNDLAHSWRMYSWGWCSSDFQFFPSFFFCPSPLPFGGSTVLETYSSTTSRSRPVPGGNRSAASCPCTVLRRASYHYATRSPISNFFQFFPSTCKHVCGRKSR